MTSWWGNPFNKITQGGENLKYAGRCALQDQDLETHNLLIWALGLGLWEDLETKNRQTLFLPSYEGTGWFPTARTTDPNIQHFFIDRPGWRSTSWRCTQRNFINPSLVCFVCWTVGFWCFRMLFSPRSIKRCSFKACGASKIQSVLLFWCQSQLWC